MWTYYSNNICTDFAVATYTNNNGVHILDVFEGRDCHFSRPVHPFFSSCKVSYFSEMNEEEEKGLSTDEILLKRLKNGCKMIEENYNEQVEKIKLVI